MWMAWLLSAVFASPVVKGYEPGMFGVTEPNGLTWRDAAGRNLVAWDETTTPCRGEPGCERQSVRIRHYVGRSGDVFLMNQLELDFECADDGGMRLWVPEIDDADADGHAVITFGIQRGCITDLSELYLDVHLWEGDRTHLLQGWTVVGLDGGSQARPVLSGGLLKKPKLRRLMLKRYEAIGQAELEEILGPKAERLPVLDLDATESTDLRDLVQSLRPEIAHRSPMSTRLLSPAAGGDSRDSRWGGQVVLETHCDDSHCSESVRVGDRVLRASEVLPIEPVGNSRSAFLLPHAPKRFLSGYVGHSSYVHGAANAFNALGCFTLQVEDGDLLSIHDFAPERDIIAAVEAANHAQRSNGLGNPLAGYRLDPRSIRVATVGQETRVFLCAVSSTDITEGSVIEIPVLAGGALH